MAKPAAEGGKSFESGSTRPAHDREDADLHVGIAFNNADAEVGGHPYGQVVRAALGSEARDRLLDTLWELEARADALMDEAAGELKRLPPQIDQRLATRSASTLRQQTGLRAALATRVQRWVAGSLEQMTDDEVLRLVEAQSPVETIAELLVATPEIQHGRDSDWSELLLRGADAKSQVSALAGGLMSPSEAARLLKISVPGVKQRLERRKLLSVPLPGGQRGFPGLQFREDGRVREGVAEVAAAGEHLDPWALLAILVDEVEDTAGGTLLERLGDESVREDVLARIAGYGEHGAA